MDRRLLRLLFKGDLQHGHLRTSESVQNRIGKPLVVETGKYAGLANGACMVRYGDTCILATATASAKPRPGIDFFPLAVDYEEKLYSVGKIPGGFLKREGKPTEKAILAARAIDRTSFP